jgi:hypothetical protein
MSEPPTREQVLVLYAEAMHAAQDLEEAVVGLIGTRREIAARQNGLPTNEEYDELEQMWIELFELTAGTLKTKPEISAELAGELGAAVTARNLLAHHYLRDHAATIGTPPGRQAIAKHLIKARERFLALWARVESERFSAMHDAELDDDRITTPGEARQMRYYDPRVDNFVPPEPFEGVDR